MRFILTMEGEEEWRERSRFCASVFDDAQLFMDQLTRHDSRQLCHACLRINVDLLFRLSNQVNSIPLRASSYLNHHHSCRGPESAQHADDENVKIMYEQNAEAFSGSAKQHPPPPESGLAQRHPPANGSIYFESPLSHNMDRSDVSSRYDNVGFGGHSSYDYSGLRSRCLYPSGGSQQLQVWFPLLSMRTCAQ